LTNAPCSATADLAAVEGWLAAAAQAERAGAQAPEPERAPAPPGTEAAVPETDRSSAPIR
jgi:hypothetical protein